MSLYRHFHFKKIDLSKKVTNGNEVTLFHGTEISVVDSICHKGFDRSYAGRNGFFFSYFYEYCHIKNYKYDFLKVLRMEMELTLPSTQHIQTNMLNVIYTV